MPGFALVIALLLVLAGTPAGAAQVATPNPAGLPRATAPFGLGAVSLPDREEDIEAVLAALPDTIAGECRQAHMVAPGRVIVAWGADAPPLGHPITLGALHFPEGDFFPAEFTAGDYVSMAMLAEDAQVVAGGRDGDLAWVRAEIAVGSLGSVAATPQTAGTLHTLAWGEVDGAWLFTAAATTPRRLEALVGAFVEAASGREGATPVA